MPKNAKQIASCDFCLIARFQTGLENISFLFRDTLEFTSEYSKALIEKLIDRIGEQDSEVALQSLYKEVDNEIVAAWMLRFLAKTDYRLGN